MKGTSWLMRTAMSFAQIERSIKAAPIQVGALYPPSRQSSTGWINWQGWDQFEKQSQSEGRQDLANAKTAVTSPWVFADVQAIAKEFSVAELIVKERVGNKLEDVDNHPLERLWDSPNEDMGSSLIKEVWAWSYTMIGKAFLYWVPDTSGTEIMEVWPVPPFMIRPIPDKRSFISGYAFKSGQDADAIFIPPEYITYSHSVNIFDLRDGLSFLAAAMTEIKADLAASQWNLNFFDENNGLPDGLVGLSPDALDQDVERVRMELRDFFGGTKRGIAVARSNDLKYTQFGRSQKDMEFGQGRELASKIIGRTLGFPDGYWSDLANRANAEQARRTMISGAVWPLLVRLAEDMNAKRRGVVHRWYGDQYRVEFKDIRPEDRELKLREFTTYQAVLPVGRLLNMIGEEPLGDVRDEMLIAEINKGTPLPGTGAAQQLEDAAAAKDEANAQALAAQAEASGGVEEEEAPAEPPPQILGYHIEQGVVSRNEARERLMLPPEDETKSQNLRDLQAMLAVVKMATDTGIDLKTAASLVGLDIPEQAPKPPPPAFGGPPAPPIEEEPPPEDVEAAPPAPEEEMPEEMKALDLDRWEKKALKALRRFHKADVAFESNAIPFSEQEAIHAALKAATSPDEVRAAFIPFAIKAVAADAAERALAEAIRRALAKQSAAALDAIEDGDQPTLDAFAKSIRAELQPALVQAMLEAVGSQSVALGVTFDPAQATALAQKWADSYVPGLVKEITDTTKQVLKSAIAQYRSDPAMTRADLVESIGGAFGPDRAEMIATTELGRAASQAAREVNGYLREHGLDYEYIWQTANDDMTCPICAPLNGTVVNEDDLPPAHPRCRCTVTQRLKKDE